MSQQSDWSYLKKVYKQLPKLSLVKEAFRPKCDHFGEKIFYDGKIDLTPIFVLKKNLKKYCFYGKLWTK